MLRNLRKIMTYLHRNVGAQLLIICCGAVITQNSKFALSVILGSVFSYIALSSMIASQTRILVTKNKNKAFIGVLNRLAYYAIPIVVALKFPDKFTLIGVLPALWIYQINYIGFELIRSIKKVKRKNYQNI